MKILLLALSHLIAVIADDTPKVIFHIIPHSHMDFGWLQTAEDYYEQ
jgi:hypothetical protein